MNQLILWDWNGTLLNDVEACVKGMNVMLKRRNRKSLSKETYLEIFTFPVQDYYKRLGFDFNKESFEELSIEYISLYKELAVNAQLQDYALEALKFFNAKKYNQVIISASEQTSLEKQIKERNISAFFDSVIGLNNIHAKSKLQNAIDYMKNTHFTGDQTIFIGDTLHDYEVAAAIGCNCVLVQNGHQNLQRFKLNGNVKIVKSLNEIKNML